MSSEAEIDSEVVEDFAGDKSFEASEDVFFGESFNLARAAEVTTSGHRRWATLRTRTINVPARIASTGRRLILHLPRDWPSAETFHDLFDAATGPPRPATT